jgi:hypothetical protein
VGDKVGGVKRLTFIPLLTPNNSTKEGAKTTYQEGKRRKRLYGFLKFCLVPNRRSVTRLREFLCDEPFDYHPYRDEDDKGFQNGSWAAYFNAIPCEWLKDAAVLIDPDTGLEPKKGRTDHHITYESISQVASRCSGNWVILIVQFTLRGDAHRRRPRLDNQLKRLKEELSRTRSSFGTVLWIAEKTKTGLPGEIALFAIGAGGRTAGNLETLLRRYEKRHGLLLRVG